MDHLVDKSGQLVRYAGRNYLIFGTTYTPKEALGTADETTESLVSHIGVNLQTGDVEEIRAHSSSYPKNIHLHELDKESMAYLCELLPIKLNLSKNLIAITGKARVGKDTIAERIANHFYHKKIISLAEPIKDIVRIVYGIEKKDRTKLIFIGQGLRRLDPCIWLKAWLKQAIDYGFHMQSKLLLSKLKYVVPDVRQYNEFIFFKSLGATTIKVTANEEMRWELVKQSEGAENAIKNKHLSDALEMHIEKFETDFHIHNNYDDKFFSDIDEILKQLKCDGE